MSGLKKGDQAPEFSASNQRGEQVRLSDFLGKQPLVLFFYPADESPICTKEACAFRDAYQDFLTAGAAVLGVSRDGSDKHQRFVERHRLPYDLLCDADGRLRDSFGVPKSLGLLPGRVTYVIDQQGVIQHQFSAQLAADKHVQEALRVLRQLLTE